MSKETPKEFAERVLRESKVDIDIEYCKRNGIQVGGFIPEFNDNMFNTESNKAAFDFVMNRLKRNGTTN